MKGVTFSHRFQLGVCKVYQEGVNAFLLALQFLLFKQNSNPKKILIFRTGSIGDSICALPAVHAMRHGFPQAKIHILTTAGTRSPVSIERLLDPSAYDAIIDYHGHSRQQLFSLVRDQQYDLVVELPQNMVSLWPMVRNMFFFRLAGIRAGWGWQLATVLLFRRVQEKHVRFPSETERLLSILERNGVKSQDLPRYLLRISPEAQQQVATLMGAKNLAHLHKRALVALVPGAKRPQNRYPLDRFEHLAEWLVGKGYHVVVVGGEEDIDKGTRLERIRNVFSFAGQLSPVESAVLLAHCHFAVSNDTGPMHLAYAAGTPVVAIFSSRDFPHKWFPPSGSITLRNNDVHCSLCLSETCVDNICMKGIPLDQLKKSVEEMETSLRQAE